MYGRKCWPGSYAALSSLTNILATLVGASMSWITPRARYTADARAAAVIQTCLISDSARPITNNLPDPEGPSLRAISRGDASMRVITRDEKTA